MRGTKFQISVGKNIGEKVHSKRKTSQCAIEGKNLLSALLKQILKGNNNLHLYNS